MHGEHLLFHYRRETLKGHFRRKTKNNIPSGLEVLLFSRGATGRSRGNLESVDKQKEKIRKEKGTCICGLQERCFFGRGKRISLEGKIYRIDGRRSKKEGLSEFLPS